MQDSPMQSTLSFSKLQIPITDPSSWNNEKFGQTVEQAISDWQNIPSGINPERVDIPMVDVLKTHIAEAIGIEIKFTEAIGAKNTPVDFNGIAHEKPVTISVKSNTNGDKVCPQNIGQTTKQRFCQHIGLSSESSNYDIKQWILNNPKRLLQEYAHHLNHCDYIIHVQAKKKKTNILIESISWYRRELFDNINWEEGECIFTKKTPETWNESSSVRFRNIPIGEFQIHNNRNNIKFRFNFRNLIKLI